MTALTRTFQARIPAQDGVAALDAMGDLLGRLERKLYQALNRPGADANALKRAFVADGISARHFNGLRNKVEAKTKGVREALKVQSEDVKRRIAVLERRIARIASGLDALAPEKRARVAFNLHQRKRRLGILRQRAVRLDACAAAPDPGICFGTRNLFNAQRHLAENGYASHAEWLADWRSTRSGEIYLIGAKCESAGNLSCQAAFAADGTATLRVRLPDALGLGKHVALTGVRFAYGADALRAALDAHIAGDAERRKPLTWRLARDAKGWRAFVSITEDFDVKVSGFDLGALGVDVNADHIAVAAVDRHGNPVLVQRFNLPSKDSPTERVRAAFGEIAKAVCALALERRVPIVVEALDFKRKKSELEAIGGPRYARMLSGLAYADVLTAIRSRAVRDGVRVESVNPAYTSTIGRFKWSERCGVSVHLSAAIAIARRGMNLSERLPTPLSRRLDNGDHVTLLAPDGCGRRHVWSRWAQVRRSERTAVLTAQRRTRMRPSASRLSSPDDERSLAQDAEFLRLLCSGGEIPPAKPSAELLGRRTDGVTAHA